MLQIAWVAAFGVLGVLARYGLDVSFSGSQGPWPVSTFVINLLGSLLAGVAYGAGIEREWLSPELRTAVMTGFLGGFTTFSAYALQGMRMLSNAPATAIAYLAVSPALGVLCAWLGLALVRKL